MLYLPCFFSFCLILGAKWTFLSCQVTAVLYLPVKIKKGILCGGTEMAKTRKIREIVGKGFQCKEWDKPAQNSLNALSVLLPGGKIENIGQTELDFALIMPEINSPLNSAEEMIYGTSYGKTSIFT